MDQDPFNQFRHWFDEASSRGGVSEPDAMVLATVSAAHAPAARVVLLKGVDQKGFSFYTNYESRKGRELILNPAAALVFYWAPLKYQVRIEGRVEKVSASESDAYWRTRPRGSQIGAWSSRQSAEIKSREELERKATELEEKYHDQEEIPRPLAWGGFRLVPHLFEFWIGRENRLHDRYQYVKNGSQWKMSLLSP